MPLPDPVSSRVVLIGSSEYADQENLPALPPVLKNIEDLAALLTDPNYGIVSPVNCTILQDEHDVTRVGRQVRAAAADAEDLLFIYFSGHGLKGGRQHELYLAMYESDVLEPDLGSLRYETLRNIVMSSPARAKVVILDCCFSGRALGDELAGGADAVAGQLEVEGTFVLASSPGAGVSLYLPNEQNTVFTGRLISTLRGGVPHDVEYITLDLLHRHLFSQLKREGLPTPEKRGSRNAEDLAIAPNRAYASVASATLRKRYAELVGRAKDGAPPGNLLTDARDLYDEQVRVLGPSHVDTLATQRLLALLHGVMGQSAEAIGLLQDLEKGLAGGSRDSHEAMATSYLLATALAGVGDYRSSVSLLRLLVSDRRRLLGPGHPATLRTQHLLARGLAVMGSLDEAEALLREIVALTPSSEGGGYDVTRDAQADLTCLTMEPAAAVEAEGA